MCRTPGAVTYPEPLRDVDTTPYWARVIRAAKVSLPTWRDAPCRPKSFSDAVRDLSERPLDNESAPHLFEFAGELHP